MRYNARIASGLCSCCRSARDRHVQRSPRQLATDHQFARTPEDSSKNLKSVCSSRQNLLKFSLYGNGTALPIPDLRQTTSASKVVCMLTLCTCRRAGNTIWLNKSTWLHDQPRGPRKLSVCRLQRVPIRACSWHAAGGVHKQCKTGRWDTPASASDVDFIEINFGP